MKNQTNSSQKSRSFSIARRRIIQSSVVGLALLTHNSTLRPFAVHCSGGTSPSNDEVFVGTEPYRYRIQHHCLSLPSKYKWQTTHNVAVDAQNQIYVIHEGQSKLKDHPSIFVFDEQGTFLRAFGEQFQGGGHGIEVRTEGSQQFLYVAAYQQVKTFSKLTLHGEVVWEQRAPTQVDFYHPDESKAPAQIWGRNRFMPTNFAFLPDGGFYLADGYGSYFIHRFDRDGKWLSAFGGPGAGEGKFDTPHGIWVDDRIEGEPRLVVTDRAHNSLQLFDLEGKFLRAIPGFGKPANIDRRGELLLVPELMARVSLLDTDYNSVATLGSDVERVSNDNGKIRQNESLWQPGKFVHPHDACFDLSGNIYVAEWVSTGRISKLTPA